MSENYVVSPTPSIVESLTAALESATSSPSSIAGPANPDEPSLLRIVIPLSLVGIFLTMFFTVCIVCRSSRRVPASPRYLSRQSSEKAPEDGDPVPAYDLEAAPPGYGHSMPRELPLALTASRASAATLVEPEGAPVQRFALPALGYHPSTAQTIHVVHSRI